MASRNRVKTSYQGVYYVISASIVSNKPERVFYIRYRKDGKMIEEKAGKQFQDNMTAAKASQIRSSRISGKELSNNEKRQEVKKKIQAEKSKWTIDKLWEEYKATKKIKSLKKDDDRFQKHISTKFGKKNPHEIDPLEIDNFRNGLLETHAPATVKNILELLRRVINFGSNKGFYEPLKYKMELPKVNNEKTENLNSEQIKSLLEVLDNETNIQLGNFMKLALFTGMRKGEITKLKWEHIDLERGFLKIVDPKGSVDSTIPLNAQAKIILEEHPKKSEWVFTNYKGEQITHSKTALRKIANRAGLPKDFRPLHGLRHVYASILASSGQVDMYVLQKLMTHKSPQMTQRYAHLRDDTLQRASNVASDFVSEALNGGELKKVG